MKRVSIISLLIILCSLPGYSQFWISFNWGESHCRNCQWMEQALHLSGRRAAEYHRIIHRYGEKIEREARLDTRYWDRSAEKIFKLRMDRDRQLQRVLSPSEFRLYVRFVREEPTRIHDYRGWYNNPHYPHYRPTLICNRYEDHYWRSDWRYTNGRWDNHFDDNHGHPGEYDRPQPPHSRPEARPPHRRDKDEWRSERDHRSQQDKYKRDKDDRKRNKRDKDRHND